MVSRPKILASLQSVSFTETVRDTIQQGPPVDLVANCHELLDGKIKDTKAEAVRAAQFNFCKANKFLSPNNAEQRACMLISFCL